MDLITMAHPGLPEADMEMTEELLRAVQRRETPDTMRIFQPGPTVAFGRLDAIRPGFDEACRVARACGRTPVVRQGGGHAAAYDRDSVIVEICRHPERGVAKVEASFFDMAALVEDALLRLDVKLEVGELPGEYCPGRFSLHLPAGPKVAGIAQRVLTRASLTAAVVVVGGGGALRSVITDVYNALGLSVEPHTVGAIDDMYPEITAERVVEAATDAARARHR
jgi:octanoyl-[GcvH]:protein N-octanoyltransferase